MRLLIITAFIGLLAFTSCKETQKISEGTAQSTYGEDFDASTVMSYADVIAKVENGEEVEAVVEGKVDAVCQAKGCWMNVVDSKNPDSSPMFVKFHDYGFFMPLDLAGGEVVMKGKAYMEETTVEELRHYAEDEGKSKEEIEAITEPERELKFMATGVKIK